MSCPPPLASFPLLGLAEVSAHVRQHHETALLRNFFVPLVPWMGMIDVEIAEEERCAPSWALLPGILYVIDSCAIGGQHVCADDVETLAPRL